MAFQNIDSLEVAAVYQSYPDLARQKLLSIRQKIFDLAQKNKDVGQIEETLKWGVPSYLTKRPKSGTTIRLQWLPSAGQFGLFVHCQTSLIAQFKEHHNTLLKFDKNRGILFDEHEKIPELIVEDFLTQALTYHLRK